MRTVVPENACAASLGRFTVALIDEWTAAVASRSLERPPFQPRCPQARFAVPGGARLPGLHPSTPAFAWPTATGSLIESGSVAGAVGASVRQWSGEPGASARRSVGAASGRCALRRWSVRRVNPLSEITLD